MRACVLLFLQVFDALFEIQAVYMALGIRRSAHAKARFAYYGNEVFGKVEIVRRNAGDGIATQGENVLKARFAHGGKCCVDIVLRCSHAGQMSHDGQREVFFHHTGDVDRARAVTASAGRIRHRNECGIQRSKLLGHCMRSLDRKVAFRRENLE